MQKVGNLGNKSKRRFLFKLDPRTKLILLVVINIIIFSQTNFVIEIACIALTCILMLLFGNFKLFIRCIVFYGVIATLLWLTTLQENVILGMLSVFLIVIRKMLPVAMFAIFLFSTTQVGEMIAALQKWKVKRGIVICIVVIMRFFPTIKEEMGAILDAAKIRGIGFNFLTIVTHPVRSMEYVLVPLILRLTGVADGLSAAAATKGVDSDKLRTSYTMIHFGVTDSIFLILYFAILVFPC